MAAPKQISLPNFDWKKQKSFGGLGKSKGHPKTARTITVKRPMHLVMKAKFHGTSKSFARQGMEIERLCQSTARNSAVQVRSIALAHDHIHMIIQPLSVRAYKTFIRAVSGLIARKVLNAQKGRGYFKRQSGTHDSSQGVAAIKPIRHLSFWEARPFTRIVEWGKDFTGLKNYLIKNRMDICGFSREQSDAMIKKTLSLIKEGKARNLALSRARGPGHLTPLGFLA